MRRLGLQGNICREITKGGNAGNKGTVFIEACCQFEKEKRCLLYGQRLFIIE